METISFNRKTLWEFIHSETFQKLENLPISYHRAISHFQNPRVDDNDILLVATFDGNKTVGYLGVMPDFVFINGEKLKIGWFSCFWVDEVYKSKNVAASLFLRVIKAWDKKIMITNIVTSLIPTYQKTKIFQATQYKTGLRCYHRFNLAHLLPPKKPIFNQIKPLLKFGDWILNILISPFRLAKKQKGNLLNFQEINAIDNKIEVLLASKFNLSNRKKNDLDWILSYPWMLQRPEDGNSKKYYFSSVSTVFYHKLFKVQDDNQRFVGFFLLKIRDQSLTIPYFYVEPSFQSLAIQFIYNWLQNNKIHTITVFLPELVHGFNAASFPFLFQKPVQKAYIVSKALPQISDLDFQDGDGDCVFY